MAAFSNIVCVSVGLLAERNLERYIYLKMSQHEKKARKPKFSREELEVLVSLVEKNNVVLTSKFGPNVTKAKKDHCWAQITEAVNSVGSGPTRSVQDIKQKWKDHKKSSKAKGKLN